MRLKSTQGIQQSDQQQPAISSFGKENNVGGFEMSLENFRNLFLNISDSDVKSEETYSYRFKSFTLRPFERQLFDHDRSVSLTPIGRED